MTRLLRKEELFEQIENQLSKNCDFVMAIDGRCGSGKSTFANELVEKFGFQVVHMDDFYLPLEMRNPQRFSKIGGNIHTERFAEQVFKNIKNKTDFYYTKFDCKILDFTVDINIKAHQPIVVEGAYSMLEQFQSLYNMKIFMDIDPDTQKERIIKRNGEADFQNFKDKWIPKEEKYLSEKEILKKCDFKFISK